MMPDNWREQLAGYEAIYFGAVGWPDTVPDHISLWGSLLKFRREFDQYVNLRPMRLMPGVACPLAKYHVDILAARFVLSPERFDVVVASNLFGDILSDLGPACTGTIGIAPSANLNPERKFPSLFEPVHGSAPDIYGKNIAKPIAMIWSGAMMLEFLGQGDANYTAAHDAVMQAVERCLREGPRTPDMGGNASTTEVGIAISRHLAEQPGQAR